MALPKGRTNNPKGRPVGIKNERVKQWEALGESITGKLADRFNEIVLDFMDSGEPELQAKGCNLYLDACEYFKPKQARTVHAGEDDHPIHITINHPI